jgi:hypothetical protein
LPAVSTLMNTTEFQMNSNVQSLGAHLGHQCNSWTASRLLVDHFHPHTPQTPGRAKWTFKPHPAFGKILGLLDWTMH